MARKRFQDLKLTDAFLFTVVMQDEEICHDTLELLLGQKVGKVHVSVEHTVLYNSEGRSIRLDVYARTDGTDDYDLEMQGQIVVTYPDEADSIRRKWIHMPWSRDRILQSF